LGVVDSCLEGGLVIVKTVIKEDNGEHQQRINNVGKLITEKSPWVIEKLATLVNFNKAFLAASSF
jgi:hypothetical protein